MDPRLPILLREKYSLVHVPTRRRCLQWVDRCDSEIDTGIPAESAGLIAARAIFPYEAKERPAPDAMDVPGILAVAHQD